MSRPPLVVSLLLAVAALTFGRAPAGRSASEEITWNAEWGGFKDVEDSAIVSETDAWAVGSSIVHFDGQKWRAVNKEPYYLGLKAIDLISPTQGWAVGWERAIPFVDGAWMPAVSLPGVMLHDVELLSASEAWAAAEIRERRTTGAIFRLEGATWHEVAVPPVGALYDLWTVSAEEGWAVGSSGTMLHYKDGAWTQVASIVEDDLLAVAGTGPNDIWAVGGSAWDCLGADATHRVMLHYDGQRWSVTLSEDECALHDVVFQDGRGWAVGVGGSRLRFDGGQWTELEPIDPSERLGAFNTVEFIPGQSAALTADYAGRIVRMDGDAFVDLHAKLGWFSELTGIRMLDASHGWAVGPGAPALRYNGSGWERDSTPVLQDMADIAGPAMDDLWAVGSLGRIAHFDGTTWSEVPSPTDVHLESVEITGAGDGWAVGWRLPSQRDQPIRGVVLRLENGVWRRFWEAPERLMAIEQVYSDDVWALTSQAHWHFDGREWQKGELGGRTIDMVSPMLGWMAGDGSIYRYDGVTWTLEWTFPAGAQVGNLVMNSNGTGWAAAWYGLVAYRDGVAWRLIRGQENPQPSDGVPNGFRDLDVVQIGEGVDLWAAGGADSILHGRHHPLAIPTTSGAPPTMTPAATAPPLPTASPIQLYLPQADRGG